MLVSAAVVGTAVALALIGRLWVGMVAGLATLGASQALVLAPTAAARVRAAARRTTSAVRRAGGRSLGWLLLAGVFVVVVLPIATIGLARDRKRWGRPRGSSAVGWVARSADPRSVRRMVATDRPPARRAVTRKAPIDPARARRRREAARGAPGGAMPARPPVPARHSRARLALSLVALALAADLLLGAVLSGTNAAPGDAGDGRRAVEVGVTAATRSRAMASAPWADDYGDELLGFLTQRSRYQPYTIGSFGAFRGRYINTDHDGRRTYRVPAAVGARPLRVAMFGGAALFGVGQRDDHTIPSELTRIAAEHGVALEVANYGHVGWVAWQEQQQFERLLASDHPPDLAVFYDGYGELLVQQMDHSAQPTHAGVAEIRALAADFRRVHSRRPGFADDLTDLASAYGEASGVVRLFDRVMGADAGSDGGAGEPTAGQETSAALDLYARSVAMVEDLSRRHDVPVLTVWQPVRAGWDDEVRRALPGGVVDLSGLFDGREAEVFIDDADTNEAGAREVAAAMWLRLEPVARDLATGQSGSQ